MRMLDVFEYRSRAWLAFTAAMLAFFWSLWSILNAVDLPLDARASACMYAASIIDVQAISVPSPAPTDRAMRERLQRRGGRRRDDSTFIVFWFIKAAMFALFSWAVWDLSLYMSRWYVNVAFYCTCSALNFAFDRLWVFGPAHWRYVLVWTLRFAAACLIPMLTMGWAYMYAWIYPPYHLRSPTLWALVFVYLPARHVLRAAVAYLAPAPVSVQQRSLDVAFDIPLAVVIYTVPDFHVVWLTVLAQVAVDISGASSADYRAVFPATQLFWTHFVGIGLAVFIEHENFRTVARVLERVMVAATAQAAIIAYQHWHRWHAGKSFEPGIIGSGLDFLFWARKSVAACLTILAISFDMRHVHDKRYL